MYHETVLNLAFPGPNNHPTVFRSVWVPFPGRMRVFHGFWVWPFGGRFGGISLCNFSRVESAGFKALFPLWPFRWPLCEFLTKTVTNLVGRHAHSSGLCPRVRLSRFSPAAEKTEKNRKNRVDDFRSKPPFFRSKPPRPKPQKFSFKTSKFSFKTPKFSFKTYTTGRFRV